MKGQYYEAILRNIKTPLGALVSFALIIEGVLMASVPKLAPEQLFVVTLIALTDLLFLIIGVTALAYRSGRGRNSTDNRPPNGEKRQVSFDDLTSAIAQVGEVIEDSERRGKGLLVKNLSLDLGYTVPWAINNFLNRRTITDVKYFGLVIDRAAPLIREHIGTTGTLQPTTTCGAIDKLSGFVERQRDSLRARNVRIEIRAYPLPPVIHGFLVNDEHLFFGFTEVRNGYVDIGETPYLYMKEDSDTNRRMFGVYRSWFDHMWDSSREVFLFDGEQLFSKY